jgi:hypothetical protein
MDGPDHKLEACIWSSHSQFGTCENWNYYIEDKENHEIFCQLSLNIMKHNDVWQKNQQEKNIPCIFHIRDSLCTKYLFDNFSPHT